MKHSTVTTRHDLRPHPTARAGPPVSAAGRWWIAVTVLGGPLLVLALLLLPWQLFDDRLPAGLLDNGLIAAAIFAPVAAVAFTLLLRVQFRRGSNAPAALWGWVVPAVYLLAFTWVGTHLIRVLRGLSQSGQSDPAWGEPPWDGFAIYGSMIVGVIVGSLLAQRVVDHLPRAPIPKARAAWVEAVPVMGTFIIVYNLFALALMTGFMTLIDGSVWFGLAAAIWVVVVFLWTISVRVALTPSGVRVTQGAFGLVATTRSIPLADVASAEVVDVSARNIRKALLCSNFRYYAFRPGPALRIGLRSSPTTTITLGMRSHAQARHAADLLITWQLEQAEAGA